MVHVLASEQTSQFASHATHVEVAALAKKCCGQVLEHWLAGVRNEPEVQAVQNEALVQLLQVAWHAWQTRSTSGYVPAGQLATQLPWNRTSDAVHWMQVEASRQDVQSASQSTHTPSMGTDPEGHVVTHVSPLSRNHSG